MIFKIKVLLLIVLIQCCHGKSKEKKKSLPQLRNDRPIIGILAQKINDGLPHYSDRDYIAASYVKFIESAGGRAVPIFTNHTKTELSVIFNSINAVLFPGGSAPMVKSPYYKTAKNLYNLAIEANDKGDYFPIWGTCLGFQSLHAIRFGNDSIISGTDAADLSLKLNFTDNVHKSKMFKNAPEHIIENLKTKEITYNHHQNCIRPIQYKKYERLGKFFRIISTNRGRKGVEFISTAEAIDYPFYGLQWHAEKNPYEWTTSEQISHSTEAIGAAQYMANFFLSEARKNHHKFATVQEETNSLIYNYCPLLTIGVTNFEEFYVF